MRPMAAFADLRAQEHKKVRILLKDNSLIQAIEVAKAALAEFGPYVGLLSDLAACQYELGLIQDCQETLERLKKEYAEGAYLLSNSSSFKTCIFLSKICEEMGAVADSLKYLQEAQKFAEGTAQIQMLAIQELRLFSFLGLRDQLAPKYLKVLNQQGNDYNHQVEMQHGLLWAEWALFGFSHAQQRMEKVLNMGLDSLDTRLMAREFLEMALLSDGKTKCEKTVLTCAEMLKGLQPTSYDLFLIQLYEQRNIEHDYFYVGDISFVQKLRILVLQILHCDHRSQKEELRKKFYFCLSGLSTESASLLKRILPSGDKSLTLGIQLDLDSSSAFINDDQVQLSSLQCEILLQFASEVNLPLGVISEKIYRQAWDESIYHRIRMQVYKLNKLFSPYAGRSLFTISKNELSLESHVRIHLSTSR